MRVRKQPMHTLDVGNLVVFAVLVVTAFVVPDDVLERWLQPLSSLGLFLIALVGLLIGRPFVREYAAASVDAETAKIRRAFRTITNAMTWMWVGAFGDHVRLGDDPADRGRRRHHPGHGRHLCPSSATG